MFRLGARQFSTLPPKSSTPFNHVKSLGPLNHIAIATKNAESAADFYRSVLGASQISPKVEQSDHGVSTVFITLGETKIELLEPLGDSSPISQFLEKNPAGGIHHICINVANLQASLDKVLEHKIRVLGKPKIGAHGKMVVFLHPKDCGGVLVELEEN
ncbi:Methylmalonyl-CoA epimerase, mitochondrial [Smittium culicis]|uniref:Methylmalonyl-CoA epimerase, mitochondrial n=1 Tax=Smittium culicis TaxID=133412 RepID=A0A1R1YMG3_9FUNG|nr:Methylmalonyl-CoA epimerase, mitochondrial [Smittium culicis]